MIYDLPSHFHQQQVVEGLYHSMWQVENTQPSSNDRKSKEG